jgi:hypothetical protein
MKHKTVARSKLSAMFARPPGVYRPKPMHQKTGEKIHTGSSLKALVSGSYSCASGTKFSPRTEVP